ncbi:MAG: hypothetical protein GY771_00975, partial [bacterium]|nr:hypothetical protein [bacterium]
MFRITIVTLAFLTLFTSVCVAGWVIETVDTAEIDFYDTSIALDSNNRPHISYYDAEDGDLKYACLSKSTWFVYSVDTDGNVGRFTSIAIDSNGNPHISYNDYTNSDLKYAYRSGRNWNITTVDTGDPTYQAYTGHYTSIALDSNDRPHISYYDVSNHDLKFAYWSGSSWYITSVDTVGFVGMHTSIALDSNDYPKISYHDNTNLDLKYASWEGFNWSISSIDGPNTNVMYSTSLALDSDDNPHISYTEQGGRIKYAYWNGSEWSISPVVWWYCGSPSLALNSYDNPHITYGYGTFDLDLKYVFWTRGSWCNVSLDTEGDVGHSNSLAIDSNDCAHVSYVDSTNNSLKYAHYELSGGGRGGVAPIPTGFALHLATPNPSDDSASIGFALPHTCEVELALYDIKGRKVATLA